MHEGRRLQGITRGVWNGCLTRCLGILKYLHGHPDTGPEPVQPPLGWSHRGGGIEL